MSIDERLDICNKALQRAAGIENPKPQYEEPETHQPVGLSLIQEIEAACTDDYPNGSTKSISRRDAERIASRLQFYLRTGEEIYDGRYWKDKAYEYCQTIKDLNRGNTVIVKSIIDDQPHHAGEGVVFKLRYLEYENDDLKYSTGPLDICDCIVSTPKRESVGWRSIDTAPKDGGVILVRTIGGHYLEAYWGDGLMNKAEEFCSGWFAAKADMHPDCWTNGVCWESNEDEEPSDAPDIWMALYKIEDQDAT